ASGSILMATSRPRRGSDAEVVGTPAPDHLLDCLPILDVTGQHLFRELSELFVAREPESHKLAPREVVDPALQRGRQRFLEPLAHLQANHPVLRGQWKHARV